MCPNPRCNVGFITTHVALLLLFSKSFVEGKVEWFRGMGLIPQGKYLNLC
jgi:hypothetical protein